MITEDAYSISYLKIHIIHEWKSLSMNKFSNELISLPSITGSVDMCILKIKNNMILQG